MTNKNSKYNNSKDNYSKDTNKDYDIPRTWDQVNMSFDDMDLSDEILRGVYSFGFERPSGIQQKAIVPLSLGHDIVAQAQSGTGKTGAFTIGVLNQIKPHVHATQAIILAPTRELVQQIYDVITSISKHIEDLYITYVIGGTEVNDDIKTLKKGVHIIIGTPGRLYDLMERGMIYTNGLRSFIIDEADQMLASDFKDQVHRIMKKIPNSCQIGIFSATLPENVMQLTKHFMKNPIHILVKTVELTLEGIKQYHVDAGCEDWKFDVLCDLYQNMNITQAIIYLNSQKKCDILHDRMHDNNFSVSRIHGRMEQSQRNEIMKSFRCGSTRVLLTTDLLARGIDVSTGIISY